MIWLCIVALALLSVVVCWQYHNTCHKNAERAFISSGYKEKKQLIEEYLDFIEDCTTETERSRLEATQSEYWHWKNKALFIANLMMVLLIIAAVASIIYILTP